MLFWILAGLTVYFVNIFVPAIIYFPAEGLANHVGSRDNSPEPSAMVGRARRSLANLQENLPIFLTLGILAMIVDGADIEQAVRGAQIFVLARIAYLILYLVSIPYTRSAAYAVGLFGLGTMAFALV